MSWRHQNDCETRQNSSEQLQGVTKAALHCTTSRSFLQRSKASSPLFCACMTTFLHLKLHPEAFRMTPHRLCVCCCIRMSMILHPKATEDYTLNRCRRLQSVVVLILGSHEQNCVHFGIEILFETSSKNDKQWFDYRIRYQNDPKTFVEQFKTAPSKSKTSSKQFSTTSRTSVDRSKESSPLSLRLHDYDFALQTAPSSLVADSETALRLVMPPHEQDVAPQDARRLHPEAL